MKEKIKKFTEFIIATIEQLKNAKMSNELKRKTAIKEAHIYFKDNFKFLAFILPYWAEMLICTILIDVYFGAICGDKLEKSSDFRKNWMYYGQLIYQICMALVDANMSNEEKFRVVADKVNAEIDIPYIPEQAEGIFFQFIIELVYHGAVKGKLLKKAV